MTTARRWGCVLLGVLLLLATPVVLHALPASDADTSASALLRRVESSRDQAFSGIVETRGTVALPANEALSGLTKLFGGTNRVRVWWRDPATWRVATLRTTGETDLVHAGNRTLRWVYESKNVTLMPDVPVRLPQTNDLLPNELARRVLSGARPQELARIPARRVAGRDALGLRLTPSDRQSSVAHVDVYADRATGLPLRVDLFAKGVRTPSVSTSLVDVTLARPAASTLRFDPPTDAHLRFDQVVDLASAADRFAARVPPRTLAGLPARGALAGSVGVYGRGPTVLLAVPLWERTAHRVRDDLEGRPGVRRTADGLTLGAPPLRLLLADPEDNDTAWLLAGTVTDRALARAAAQLRAHPPGLRVR